MNKQEMMKREIKYSVDLRGKEITECFIDAAIIAACIIMDEHPCVGCRAHECKHNYND